MWDNLAAPNFFSDTKGALVVSVELGQGDANFKSFFEKLKQFHYTGPYILQAFRDNEGVEIFKRQLTWIKEYLPKQ